MALPAPQKSGFGEVLRQWRRHRGLSQLALALEAGVSPRHLSFLETGRSSPSQEMVLRLLESLAVPLWDRNRWLLAAGYAPTYRRSALDASALEKVGDAVRLHLERHQPFPAYAMDAAWNVVAANAPFEETLAALSPQPADPRNILQLICHPDLLRPAIVNWDEVALAVFRRVRRQLDSPLPAAELKEVVDAISTYPGVADLLAGGAFPRRDEPVVPIEIQRGARLERWITTLITFGAALDLAVDELVIECFFPADEATERWATSELPRP